ncbi:MAG TPA: hypothetical protein DCY52_02815 [Methylococcaceae bacterium]|nr:hypothetical protein [Methylococcaceae bacterium]
MHRSFIDKDNYFFVKVASLLSLISIVLYVVHDPVGPPSGNSWLGYTLGTIAGIIILWLVWFGVRKRTYINNRFSLVQWLSGHVWLGTSLLVLATLHCGFQFDPNMHTVFYFVMVLTVISGMVGVYFYIKVPASISRNLEKASSVQMHEEVDQIAREALEVAREIDPDVHELILFSVDRLFLGHRLPTRKGLQELERVGASLVSRRGRVMTSESKKAAEQFGLQNPVSQARKSFEATRLHAFVIDLCFDRSPGEKLQKLLDLINDIVDRLTRLEKDRVANRQIRIWLLFHVPLSLATVIGLFVHIVSVFYY